MTTLALFLSPNPRGGSFQVIIGEINITTLEEAQTQTNFEITIIKRAPEIQGDMVQERIEDVINPYLRLCAHDLEKQLKQLRQQERK
jgi:hypothetical protein